MMKISFVIPIWPIFIFNLWTYFQEESKSEKLIKREDIEKLVRRLPMINDTKDHYSSEHLYPTK